MKPAFSILGLVGGIALVNVGPALVSGRWWPHWLGVVGGHLLWPSTLAIIGLGIAGFIVARRRA